LIANTLASNLTFLTNAVNPDDIQTDCAAGSQILGGEATYAITCSEHDLTYYFKELRKFMNQFIIFVTKWATIPF
jgi:hypothetical protein